MARAGTGVKHLALDRPQRDKLLYDLLRAADVPRGGRRQAMRELLIAIHLLVAAGIDGGWRAHPVTKKRPSTERSVEGLAHPSGQRDAYQAPATSRQRDRSGVA